MDNPATPRATAHRAAALLAAFALALSLLAACPCIQAPCPTAGGDGSQTELIVRFSRHTSPERIDQIAAALGLEPLASPLEGHRLFRAASPRAARAALEALRAMPEVELAQPNYRYRPAG